MRILDKIDSKKAAIIDAAAIVVGSGLTALGISCFTLPNNIAPGGVSGLATAAAHMVPISVGAMSLIINIPIFALALKILGLRPLIKTGIATLFLSVLIDVFSLLPIQYTGNILLAAVLGGGLMGIGIGLLFTRNISTGGVDLFNPDPEKKASPHVDGFADAAAGQRRRRRRRARVWRDRDRPLFHGDHILLVQGDRRDHQGVDYAKVVYIITENGEDIVRKLTLDLGKGVTQVFARGGYTGRDKMMIMTVARRTELAAIQKIVREHDDSAFVIYLDATEVRGEGFKALMD